MEAKIAAALLDYSCKAFGGPNTSAITIACFIGERWLKWLIKAFCPSKAGFGGAIAALRMAPVAGLLGAISLLMILSSIIFFIFRISCRFKEGAGILFLFGGGAPGSDKAYSWLAFGPS